jgi:dolichol-phosphate mannosyltransferase
LEMSNELSARDPRFCTIWAPENRNLVDAYLRGFREAIKNGHEYIIEMDAGLSHDPRAIPMFLRVMNEGNECAFGSRFMNGGSMVDSPFNRRFLSKGGTVMAKFLLGARLSDMTSGFQGFRIEILKRLVSYPLLSKAHFYQTEVRYLLRNARIIEVPIHYRAPSPRVSHNAIRNSIDVLLHYFWKRMSGNSPSV